MDRTRILQLTDLHLFCDPESTLKGVPTRRTLQQVVGALLQEKIDFDHVVVTGDHTHDERPESYAVVREILAPWVNRLAVIPGNHDDREVMRSIYRDVIERQATDKVSDDDRITFSFQCDSWLCLGLDTHAPGQVSGEFGAAQAAWLSQQLVSHGDNPSIIFCHHPPVDVGSDWMDRIGLLDRSLLLDIVQNHPSLRLICCGHVHHEFEGVIGRTRVVTTPSTGVQFDPQEPEPRFTSDPPGCRIIELTDNQLETRIVRVAPPELTQGCD